MKRLALVLGLFLECGPRGLQRRSRSSTAPATRTYAGSDRSLLRHERARTRRPQGPDYPASRTDPIWFSSARDAIAFTMLPEEPKDIRAIYVSDMAKAPSWEDPGANNWVDARQALFVIGSRVKGWNGCT